MIGEPLGDIIWWFFWVGGTVGGAKILSDTYFPRYC